jgi:hypothetical protein
LYLATIMTTEAAPLATHDVGLGTAYERVAIYDLFERWTKDLSIQSACEGPLDGMAGIQGLHLLGLARRGTRVTVCLPDDEALDRVRAIYRRQRVDSTLVTRRLEADAIPEGRFDLLVSYNSIPYVQDWRGYLRRLLAANARWFIVVVSNPTSYGTYLRRIQRALRGEHVLELFDHEGIRRGAIEPVLATFGHILRHDYLDCPWWPDFLLPARKNLAGDALATVKGLLGCHAGSDEKPRFVFGEDSYPFFDGEPQYEETMRSIRFHPVFDKAPDPIARFFGHLHGYLVEKP